MNKLSIALLAALLALMLIGLTSCGDGAGGGPGEPGSSGNPFIVASAESLAKVGIGDWGLDACYKQTEDITLDGAWLPIGTQANPFTGTYDGGGNTITGLTVDRAADYNGLFGYVKDGTIRGVRLTNVAITITGNYSYTGPVAGSITGGAMISNCSATGTIIASYVVGGIAGYCANGSVVEHCSSGMTINTTGSYIGGVVGYNEGVIKYCSSSGAVKGIAYTGGVAGHNPDSGLVQNSYATGNVTGTDIFIGGVIGSNYGGTVEYCYASGNVSGVLCVGGIAGVNEVSGTVQNCAALCASVTATTEDAGHVIGYNNATATNCFGRQSMTVTSGGTNNYAFPGTNVPTSDYGNQNWWQRGAPDGPGFNLGSSGAWKWDSALQLPVLK